MYIGKLAIEVLSFVMVNILNEYWQRMNFLLIAIQSVTDDREFGGTVDAFRFREDEG